MFDLDIDWTSLTTQDGQPIRIWDKNKMDRDKCGCDEPIIDCRNDWEGEGPPPLCPNVPIEGIIYETEC